MFSRVEKVAILVALALTILSDCVACLYMYVDVDLSLMFAFLGQAFLGLIADHLMQKLKRLGK